MELQDKIKMVKNIANVGLILALAFFYLTKNREYKELQSLNNTLTEDLKVTKNKEGLYTAKIEAYETEKIKDFIKYKTIDSLTLNLQKEIKEVKRYLQNQGSVTNFSTTTKIDTIFKTEVVEVNGNEIYNSDFNLDNWVTGNLQTSKEGAKIDLNIKNAYTVVIGKEKQGFLGLKKSKPFVKVTNKNPYTETKTLKTYQVSLPKPNKFIIGPSVGYQLNSEGLQPYIGFGIQYRVIGF